MTADGWRVLVCDRGFVLVGKLRPHPTDYLFVVVDRCAAVRRWGTAHGLGQLAREGPLPDTVLDHEGDGVEVLKTDIKRAIPADQKKWQRWAGTW